MSPSYRGRTATAEDVVPHETATLRCRNGHTWVLNPASLEADDGKACCWAPACEGAPLQGVSAETLARRQLAARLHDAVVEQQRGQLNLAVPS